MPRSNTIYYALQRAAGSLRPGRLSPLDSFKAAVSMVEWVKRSGQEAVGKSFLEVGTGRTVNLPTALWLCGAGRIVTVDLHPYLSGALVAESNQFVRQHEDEVRQLFGSWARTPLFTERFNQLVDFAGDLDHTLRLRNVEYISPGDAAKLPFADRSFNFHISHAVFEHIPGSDILNILTEARRVLVPQGLLLHIIDPSDHFAHDDKSIAAINFLQFDDSEWEGLAGNQFTYHNRMRAFEYLELFKCAGVSVLWQQQSIDEPSLQALRDGFRLNPQFQHIPLEELAVTSLNMVGQFSDV
ncbi:MAG: class I SAM-dependent methyltransferase [Acidobacteriota bacterium]|nr:class I SAM-dependent methyltransferase [Acidobacteriota bacterium]